MKNKYIILTFFMLILASCASDKFVTVRAYNDYKTYNPGGTVTTAFQFEMTGGWHIYWQNPGDAGLATQIDWVLPKGFGDVSVDYSIPNKYTNEDIGDYGYKPKGTVITSFRLPKDLSKDTTYELTAYVKYLKCKDICVPGGDTLKIQVQVKKAEPVLSTEGKIMNDMRNVIFPYDSPNWTITFNKTEKDVTFTITPKNSESKEFGRIEFYPITEGVFSNSAKQVLVSENGQYLLTVPFDPLGSGLPESFSGIFVADKPWDTGKSRAIKYKVVID
jgi:thiol:disulfide interchange protein DsbD